MNWPGPERWLVLCEALGAAVAGRGWYERLAAAYSEPQRHYHTQQHIGECLLELDQAIHLAIRPAEVELALWFHDAVYDPRAADNEERSANLAKQFVTESGLSARFAQRMERLILMTKSHQADADADEAILLDIDLSILGRAEKRFAEYEQQIRQEFEWVPGAVYAAKRLEIWERFLCRDCIYATEWFREKYERQARINLAGAIERLRHGREGQRRQTPA